MNAYQENKVSSLFKSKTFFNEHGVTLAANLPYLVTAIASFTNELDLIEDYEMQASESTIGYTLQKQANRQAMQSSALIVSNGLKALALSTSDLVGVKNASFTKTQFDNYRDTEALYWAGEILEDAQAVAPLVLVPFGIPGSFLISFAGEILSYKNFIQKPKYEKSESAMAGVRVDEKIAKCDSILELIDALIRTQKDIFPDLYLLYFNTRKIDDDQGGSSPTPPDFIVDLQTGVFTEIVSMPYNAGQRFKAENKGVNDVFWSLSVVSNAFSTPPNTLVAGASSTLLSSTLAANGNSLVFLNSSPIPITIEITVVED